MTHRLFDVTEEIVNGLDFEVHRKRAYDPKDFEARKRTAESLLHEGRYNNIFKIAGIAKLPVLVMRDVEKEYRRKVAKEGERNGLAGSGIVS